MYELISSLNVIFLQYFSVLEQLFPDNSPMYKYYCNKV